MPDMSGFEYMDWLKNNPVTRHIPVVFVSSHAEPDVVSCATLYDIKGYIKKPVNPRLLKERIHEILAQR
jgi:putative two-component system response regulator